MAYAENIPPTDPPRQPQSQQHRILRTLLRSRTRREVSRLSIRKQRLIVGLVSAIVDGSVDRLMQERQLSLAEQHMDEIARSLTRRNTP